MLHASILPFCLQEQRLRYLKQQEQRQQQQASEQEKLQRLRENIENQEARLKKVRALKGQVEQKRLSNGKLGELNDFVNFQKNATYCSMTFFLQYIFFIALIVIVTPFLSISVEEIEQMNNLFQQKQRELVMAASKVEELSRQLELLKNGKMENFHDNQSSVAELDRLYKELQVCRCKLNSKDNILNVLKE